MEWSLTIIQNSTHVTVHTVFPVDNWTEVCGAAVLAKQRFRVSLFWLCSFQRPISPCLVSFQRVTYVVLTDIPVLFVCRSQSSVRLKNTSWLTGGGFTVKCKNEEQIGYVSLRCFVCQQLPHGRSGCSLIHTVHVHTDAVWSQSKEMDHKATAHLKNNDWLRCVLFFMTVWVYVCICTSGTMRHMQPSPKKTAQYRIYPAKIPNNSSYIALPEEKWETHYPHNSYRA